MKQAQPFKRCRIEKLIVNIQAKAEGYSKLKEIVKEIVKAFYQGI
jgi:hypothetical protein